MFKITFTILSGVFVVIASCTAWAQAPSIKKGMTLKQLEALNGKPFTLNGFECDDGGAVCSWEGGKLEAFGKSHRWIQLGLSDVQFNDPANKKLFDAVFGCKCYPSNSEAMQKLNPTVYMIKSK